MLSFGDEILSSKQNMGVKTVIEQKKAFHLKMSFSNRVEKNRSPVCYTTGSWFFANTKNCFSKIFCHKYWRVSGRFISSPW